MGVVEITIVWIALCLVAGHIAAKKGRSGAGFFLLALLLSPLIGIIAAVIASPDKVTGDTKKCPYCGKDLSASLNSPSSK